MNIFNRIFNIDECSSTKSPAIHFNSHPYESSHHHHVTPIHATIATRIIQLTNCRLVRHGQLVKDDLWIRDGRILDPLKVFYEEKRQADLQIDCDDLVIAPGFIDTQLNGAFGRDFTNDPDVADCLATVSAKLLQYGVTAYCPTIISSQPHVYAALLPQMKRTTGRTTGRTCGQSAQILGLHLEGPFISKHKPGAHDQTALATIDKGILSVEEMYGMSVEKLKDVVSIITLAPELDPIGQVVRELTENNIIVSVGHSEANLSQGETAIRNGARFITHLFNAMLPFHHRDPHLIGLLSDRDFIQQEKVFYGIIADNIHTHPSAINIAYKAHPKGNSSCLGISWKICEIQT
jgi:N-acetylglucosamine-6-phosphate deacetylase